MALSTPIAFFIFNRPDLTEIVFQAIRQAKPKKLLVVADGHRFPEEEAKCLSTREVIKSVDWDCEVLTNFSDKNLGCKKRVSSGLKWVFSEVEEAIILEDDCLPSQSFFIYCQNLLEYYRNEPRVTSINGSNFDFFQRNYKYSYRFSKFMNMWGWATWRRTFEIIDFEIKFWNSLKSSPELPEILGRDKIFLDYWIDFFDKTYNGEIDTWDYQWILSNLYHRGIVVSPVTNMIKNIGHRSDATHTYDENHYFAQIEKSEIKFPLIHPPNLKISKAYEEYLKSVWCQINPPPSLISKIKTKIERLIFS